MSKEAVKSKEYVCPACKGRFNQKPSSFPFCSERCRLVDLGGWVQENYTIPGKPADPQECQKQESEED